MAMVRGIIQIIAEEDATFVVTCFWCNAEQRPCKQLWRHDIASATLCFKSYGWRRSMRGRKAKCRNWSCPTCATWFEDDDDPASQRAVQTPCTCVGSSPPQGPPGAAAAESGDDALDTHVFSIEDGDAKLEDGAQLEESVFVVELP